MSSKPTLSLTNILKAAAQTLHDNGMRGMPAAFPRNMDIQSGPNDAEYTGRNLLSDAIQNYTSAPAVIVRNTNQGLADNGVPLPLEIAQDLIYVTTVAEEMYQRTGNPFHAESQQYERDIADRFQQDADIHRAQAAQAAYDRRYECVGTRRQ